MYFFDLDLGELVNDQDRKKKGKGHGAPSFRKGISRPDSRSAAVI